MGEVGVSCRFRGKGGGVLFYAMLFNASDLVLLGNTRSFSHSLTHSLTHLDLNTLDGPPLCKTRKTQSHLDAKLGTYIPPSSTYLSLTDLA